MNHGKNIAKMKPHRPILGIINMKNHQKQIFDFDRVVLRNTIQNWYVQEKIEVSIES